MTTSSKFLYFILLTGLCLFSEDGVNKTIVTSNKTSSPVTKSKPPALKNVEVIPGKSAIYSKVMASSKALLDEYRKTSDKTNKVNVAIMEFDSVGPAVKKLEIGDGIAEMVTSQFGKLPGAQVIDRKRMKAILKELSMSSTGLIDDTQAKQMGRIMAADLILTGSVSQLGKMIQIVLRLTDVETAQQVGTTTIELLAESLVPMAQAVSVEDKFPITAAFRSFSVPGWGHFYNDQPFFGVFYLVTVAGGVGTSLYLTLKSQETYKNYNQINAVNYLDYYPKATSPGNAAKLAYADATTLQNYALIGWISTGGLYVVNILHAWITAAIISERKKAFSYQAHQESELPQLSFSFDPKGDWNLSMNLNF